MRERYLMNRVGEGIIFEEVIKVEFGIVRQQE